MSFIVKLFFSVIAIAVPLMFWRVSHRSKTWRRLTAIVEDHRILRIYINPAWRVQVAYEFEGKPYLTELTVYAWQIPNGVAVGQKITLRANTKSPEKCFIETASDKPASALFNYIFYTFAVLMLVTIWIS